MNPAPSKNIHSFLEISGVGINITIIRNKKEGAG